MAAHPSTPSPDPRVSLHDFERAAAALLDPATLGYFAGGAADEISMRDNVRAWRRLAIRPRVLVGAGEIDRSVTVLGRPRPNPLIVAPMAYQGLAHPDAEIGTAKAAAATGATV